MNKTITKCFYFQVSSYDKSRKSLSPPIEICKIVKNGSHKNNHVKYGCELICQKSVPSLLRI